MIAEFVACYAGECVALTLIIYRLNNSTHVQSWGLIGGLYDVNNIGIQRT